MTCKHVTYLLGSGLLAHQPWSVRLKVRYHLWICQMCERVNRQLRQLHHLARRSRSAYEPDPGLEDRLVRKLTQR